MLHILRKGSQTIFFRGLMFLLLLTFILWGVGDIFRSGNKVVAFKVGTTEFTEIDWHNKFKKSLHVMSQQFGKQISREEAKQYGLHRYILTQEISSMLLDNEVRELGLFVSDDMAKAELASVPAFQKDGRFDGDMFNSYLRSTNESEEEFINNFKRDLAKRFLMMSIAMNNHVPKVMVANTMAARAQVHNAAVVKLNYNDIKIQKQPSDQELEDEYKANLDIFSSEEKRDLSYITFGLQDVKVDSQVSDEVLKEQYEAKKVIFTEPEKRKVSQMLFKDSKQADEAIALLNEGTKFADVARKFFPQQKDFSLGEVSEHGFDKIISEAIFKTEVGHHSAVTQSPLGYHIFFIETAIPAKLKPFDEVKSMLTKQYLDEIKFEALSKLTQEVDNMVASGTELPGVAQKYNFKLESIKGYAESQQQKDILLQNPVFKQLAKTTGEKQASIVTPLSGQDQFILLVVDKIEKPQPIEFSQVKDKVAGIWAKKNMQAEIISLANKVYEKLSSGANPDDIIKEIGVGQNKAISISYFNKDKAEVPAALVANILAGQNQQVLKPVEDDANNLYIAKISSIQKTEIIKMEDGDKIMAELQQQLMAEISDQYFDYLKSKFGVEVNDKVINSVVDTE